MTTIGIIKEGKIPPDFRVPLTPAQCAEIQGSFPVKVIVEPSVHRAYTDAEYLKAGIELDEDMSQCHILLGVKEVPIEQLIPGKTYLFFSHTIKEQPYNRKLLQTILKKNIRLIDYEAITEENGQRVIAFGYFAGMVGAHNGILTHGLRTGSYNLKRMRDCFDYEAAKREYQKLKVPAIKIVVTGTGRVGSGAAKVLKDMGIQKVDPADFLEKKFPHAVFTQVDCWDFCVHKENGSFDLQHYFAHPDEYKSAFAPYTKTADIMINGIYWDNRAPAFFTLEEMRSPDFRIRIIADITCDIAPESSIPSTLRATTIEDPIFGYDPFSGKETDSFSDYSIDMMTIDNLPSELPRDSSKAFGQQLIEKVLPELLKQKSEMIEQATIARNGELGKHFAHLQDYVNS